jgi:hypothetical protein
MPCPQVAQRGCYRVQKRLGGKHMLAGLLLGAAASRVGLYGSDGGHTFVQCVLHCRTNEVQSCNLQTNQQGPGQAHGQIISPTCQILCSGGWAMQCLASCC